MTFTFEDLTTPGGMAAAAALIMALVQILKAVAPGLFARMTGALWAFIGTAVLYVIGAVVLAPTWANANAGLAFFIAWVSCALIALGIHGVASSGTTTFIRAAGDPGPGR